MYLCHYNQHDNWLDAEDKLKLELQIDKDENFQLLKEKMEVENILSSAKYELNAIEHRNKAFEGKLVRTFTLYNILVFNLKCNVTVG